jgi:hypothetical protein
LTPRSDMWSAVVSPPIFLFPGLGANTKGSSLSF